jgi:hypothetical protein
MSAPLPTEEDVLALLTLYAARPVLTNIYSTAQTDERLAWNAAVAPISEAPLDPVAVVARARLRSASSVEAAIGDSERRWEVERAVWAVVAAASSWDGQGGLSNLDRCVRRLNEARLALGTVR